MYAISAAIITRDAKGWESRRELPTFYLDENVQGILTEQAAERIASAIVNPYGIWTHVSISAVKI